MVGAGQAAARQISHACILLKADRSQGSPHWTDGQIAQALEVSRFRASAIPSVPNVPIACTRSIYAHPLSQSSQSRTPDRPTKTTVSNVPIAESEQPQPYCKNL